MILVDTSVLIDFFSGQKNEGTKKLENILQRGIPFGITSVIFQEVLQGAKSLKEYKTLKHYLENQKFYHLKNAVESFASAAKIYFACRQKGITIRSTIDCIIAQTAIENNLLLLHNDKDFYAITKVIDLKCY
jgi:predicted nucleic acid-binding protein